MLIAIDFDGTFAADPRLFHEFARLARSFGHRVVVVSGRSDEPPWGDELREVVGDGIPVVLAGSIWKRAAAEAAGYRVDIWIDDNPEYVGPQDPSLAAVKTGLPVA